MTTSFETLRQRLGDRYTIERELGRGGMGAVYLARDLRLDRQVALKVLPPELAEDAALRERFLRETRTAASFSHPNIVPVHEVVEREGVIAFAMGFVEGESLSQRVRRMGPLDVRGIVRVLQDIGYALAYAHGRGVVHRDIKPDNIMLERATGRALLMDFGISRAITATVSAPGLTRVGEVVGTPEYMSPEQASGDQVDGRSDIYSLGLAALFALAGRSVITGDSTQKILVKQLTELPPPAASMRADIPAALATAIDTCVAKLPAERFATAESLVEAIDSAQLSAPEIPLPVRLFAQEAAGLGLILWFMLVVVPFLTVSMSTGGNLDALLPITLMLAVAAARTMVTVGSARRLAKLGYMPADVLKGMQDVVAERDTVRAQNLADPSLASERRKKVKVAWLRTLVAIGVLYAVWSSKVKVGHMKYTVPWYMLVAGMVALVMLIFSFVTFVRSPLRVPIGERAFRLVWLGASGRAFLRFAARGMAAPAGSLSVSANRAMITPVFVPVAGPPPKPSSTLEERVTALEKWREGQR